MVFLERYFVNEEKKTVVCKLENCSGSLICDMSKKGWPGHPAMIIDDEFTGKSRCSAEDVFDVEIGKRIAYKRALAKVCKAKRRALLNFIEGQIKFAEDIARDAHKLISKYEATIEKKDRDITRILGE